MKFSRWSGWFKGAGPAVRDAPTCTDGPAQPAVSYDDLLRGQGFDVRRDGLWSSVGPVEEASEKAVWWILISAEVGEAVRMLAALSGFLRSSRTPFRVVRDERSHRFVNGDGHSCSGHFLVLPVVDREDVAPFAQWLLGSTAGLKGSACAASIQLSSCVYLQPGAAHDRSTHNPPPSLHRLSVSSGAVAVGGSSPRGGPGANLGGGHVGIALLGCCAHGDEWLALDVRRAGPPAIVRLKRRRLAALGLENAWSLEGQARLHRRLLGQVPVAEVAALFREDGYECLATPANTMSVVADLEPKPYSMLGADQQMATMERLLSVGRCLRALHQRGYALIDFSLEQFGIDARGDAMLLDLELERPLGARVGGVTPTLRMCCQPEHTTASGDGAFDDVAGLAWCILRVLQGDMTYGQAPAPTGRNATAELRALTGAPMGVVHACASILAEGGTDDRLRQLVLNLEYARSAPVTTMAEEQYCAGMGSVLRTDAVLLAEAAVADLRAVDWRSARRALDSDGRRREQSAILRGMARCVRQGVAVRGAISVCEALVPSLVLHRPGGAAGLPDPRSRFDLGHAIAVGELWRADLIANVSEAIQRIDAPLQHHSTQRNTFVPELAVAGLVAMACSELLATERWHETAVQCSRLLIASQCGDGHWRRGGTRADAVDRQTCADTALVACFLAQLAHQVYALKLADRSAEAAARACNALQIALDLPSDAELPHGADVELAWRWELCGGGITTRAFAAMSANPGDQRAARLSMLGLRAAQVLPERPHGDPLDRHIHLARLALEVQRSTGRVEALIAARQEVLRICARGRPWESPKASMVGRDNLLLEAANRVARIVHLFCDVALPPEGGGVWLAEGGMYLADGST